MWGLSTPDSTVLRSEREERKHEYPLLGEIEWPCSRISVHAHVSRHRGKPTPLEKGLVFALLCIWLPMGLREKLRWSSCTKECEWASAPVSHHRWLMGSKIPFLTLQRERGELHPCSTARPGAWSPVYAAGGVSRRFWVISWVLSYTWLFSPDLSPQCPVSCDARELLPAGGFPAGFWELRSIILRWESTRCAGITRSGLENQPQLI